MLTYSEKNIKNRGKVPWVLFSILPLFSCKQMENYENNVT